MITKIPKSAKIKESQFRSIGPNAIAINNLTDKINEIIEAINPKVKIVKVRGGKKPIVYNASREKTDAGFNEVIILYDIYGNIIAHSPHTHPKSYFAWLYGRVEYFSQPNSNGSKPVYHRIL